MNVQETQFLATALQKPLVKQAITPTTLLSVYSSTPSGTPLSTTPSLPSIDLGLAISNFTSNPSNSSSDAIVRKRKLMEQKDTATCKSETEDRRGDHMVMVDMTPPSSIINDEPQDSNQHRQDTLSQENRVIPSGRSDSTLRPYQSQCRGTVAYIEAEMLIYFYNFLGERPRNARVPFCPHCGEDCLNISVLRYHVKTTHSEPSGCLCCCFCTAIFNLHSSTEYKQHTLETHGVKYT